MMRCLRGLPACALLSLILLPARLAAQEPVTITGHVSSGSAPVRGASVRIESLDVGALTDVDGRYSFIVPSTKVRGQKVALTARYLRLRPQSVDVTLVGGSLTQDFDLVALDAPARPGDRPRTADPVAEPVASPPGSATPATSSVAVARARGIAAFAPLLDSLAFADVAAPTTFAGALAGRFAGLEVLSSSAVGGTVAMYVRGPRSISGLTQPLVVVNGIEIDDGNVTSESQRSGAGGFDYGTTLNDLNLDDVGSVQLLRGPLAAMRYGGRAANGVLLVTTKNGRGLSGISVSGNQQLSSSTPLRLFEYQNTYGQGRGGAFVFFNGKGAGVNDAVDESWGPAMEGQPVVQASLTEAERPEVRAFLPHPSNVSDFFSSGSSLTTNVAIQGGGENGNLRAAISNRALTGITPSSAVTYRSATITGALRPSPSLSLSADVLVFSDRGEDRPGSGFDESNVVSVFSHMPRSVDVAAYETRLRDAGSRQLSWNYAGHNNPYFAVKENDNHDDRSRLIAGGSATYAISEWLSASARAGRDDLTEKRFITVAPGWMGGFPYFAGRGDFSTGGFQNDEIGATRTTAELSVRGTPASTSSAVYAFNAGVGYRGDKLQTKVSGADQLTSSFIPTSLWNGSSTTNYAFGGVEATLDRYISLAASVRTEASELISGSSETNLYPALLGSIDLARRDSRSAPGMLETFAIRGGWSRSGNDATAARLQRAGVTNATPTAVLGPLAAPEITTGWELGTTMRGTGGRYALDVTYYNERSENLVFPLASGFAKTGSVSNKGIEATAFLVPFRFSAEGEWSVGLNVAKNTNQVESLGGGATSALLGLPFDGARIEARVGGEVGSIVGLGYRRDASGNLVLRNGRPLADSAAGVRVLGSSLPSWTAGLSSGYRYRALELHVLFDARQGGKIFSASNRAAAVSGNAIETISRPEEGILIAGTDIATGAANTVRVSTENYYRSLTPIAERWVYDASFVKLREARLSISVPLTLVRPLHTQSARLSLIGRNLALWTDAPNIDPESVLSAGSFRGAEMGQLPTMKSVGLQISVTP